MKIYFIMIALGIGCYIVGLIVGLLLGSRIFKDCCAECKEIFIDVDQDDIQHVGYTQEQCGYDK